MQKMHDYPLKLTKDGYVFITQEDHLDRLVDILVDTDYPMEVCLALDFDPLFLERLMEAGFLVMSAPAWYSSTGFLLLPKLHLVRSVIFFPDLHVKKSIWGYLDRYELRFDTDFDLIVDNCVEIHGDDWLTPPLLEGMRAVRKFRDADGRTNAPRPVSFGLYRDGVLKAGEFGVLIGGVYTSYSGYYEENNAGTVQMILMAWYLEKRGSPFLDLGMPLPYKADLGAVDILPCRFVELFRKGRAVSLKRAEDDRDAARGAET